MQGEFDIASELGLVSCLCVTEDRAAFMPWLLWNYAKQDHPQRELVVVDGSSAPLEPPVGVRVVRCPPGTSVARKRNLAVEAAQGELLAWFDDDDWQHPRRLSILAASLASGAVLAGPGRAWFVDLQRSRARPYDARRGVIFNGLGVRRAALSGVRFDERRARAADTEWLSAVRRGAARRVSVVPDVLACWLCHDTNLSNPAGRRVFTHPLAAVVRAVGGDAWGGTEEHLAQLRSRLTGERRLERRRHAR
jgi:glycosyltransferase involved in cell wall biosynthesis